MLSLLLAGVAIAWLSALLQRAPVDQATPAVRVAGVAGRSAREAQPPAEGRGGPIGMAVADGGGERVAA